MNASSGAAKAFLKRNIGEILAVLQALLLILTEIIRLESCSELLKPTRSNLFSRASTVLSIFLGKLRLVNMP